MRVCATADSVDALNFVRIICFSGDFICETTLCVIEMFASSFLKCSLYELVNRFMYFSVLNSGKTSYWIFPLLWWLFNFKCNLFKKRTRFLIIRIDDELQLIGHSSAKGRINREHDRNRIRGYASCCLCTIMQMQGLLSLTAHQLYILIIHQVQWED